jgi:hypothetical protein
MVIHPAINGVAKDSVVNTFAFDVSGPTPTTYDAIKAGLKTFYDAWDAYRSPLQKFQSSSVKMYDLADPKPRPPVYDQPLGLTTTVAANTLPTELSICVSFQGGHVAGIAQRRRRGRVYLGPWGTTAADTTLGRPTPGICAALGAAATAFLAASDAASTWSWVVVSEATGTVSPVLITDGWVDNAWDIQRRRGIAPTLRNAWT